MCTLLYKCLNIDMTFWEFFFENRQGEKKSKVHTNVFKGFDGTKFRMTYDVHRRASGPEQQIEDIRLGRTASQPVDNRMLSYLTSLNIDLPTKQGDFRFIGRSGDGRKQAKLTKTATGYTLKGA